MSTPIRILLVDDHSQVHRALRVINDTYDDLELVAHASNGIEAIQLCAEHQPDLILMDVIMPGMDGIEGRAPFMNVIHRSKSLLSPHLVTKTPCAR